MTYPTPAIVLAGIAILLFTWSYIETRRAKAKGIKAKNSRMFGREFRPNAPIALAFMIAYSLADLIVIGMMVFIQAWLVVAFGVVVLVILVLGTRHVVLRPPRDGARE